MAHGGPFRLPSRTREAPRRSRRPNRAIAAGGRRSAAADADEVGAGPAQRLGLLARLDVEGDARHLEDLRPPGDQIAAPRAGLVAVLEMRRRAEGDVVGAGLGRASWRRGARCRHRRRRCRAAQNAARFRIGASRVHGDPRCTPSARSARASSASPASSAAAPAFCAISTSGLAEPRRARSAAGAIRTEAIGAAASAALRRSGAPRPASTTA